jgi:hypothetical protein
MSARGINVAAVVSLLEIPTVSWLLRRTNPAIPGSWTNFLGALPFLDLLFAADGLFHAVVKLVVDKRFDAITLTEAREQSLLMFAHPAPDVAGHTGVKDAVWGAGEQVSAGIFCHLISPSCGGA